MKKNNNMKYGSNMMKTEIDWLMSLWHWIRRFGQGGNSWLEVNRYPSYSIIMPHQLDYELQTYIAVTLSSSSPYFTSPPALAARHAWIALNYVGQVGELSDVHLYSIPKSELVKRGRSIKDVENLVVQDIRGSDGVLHVEVQMPRQRIRRAGEEL